MTPKTLRPWPHNQSWWCSSAKSMQRGKKKQENNKDQGIKCCILQTHQSHYTREDAGGTVSILGTLGGDEGDAKTECGVESGLESLRVGEKEEGREEWRALMGKLRTSEVSNSFTY